MLSMPDSLLRGICIATLGASFFGFSGATPVQAQSVQVLEPGTAAESALIERRMQAAYQQIAPAIVRITYGTRNERTCSGAIVTADGYVVTGELSSSFVQDDLLAFHLSDGRRVRGKALGWSSAWAIGLLKITEKGPWSHVDLSNGAAVKAGQLCVALVASFFLGRNWDTVSQVLQPTATTKTGQVMYGAGVTNDLGVSGQLVIDEAEFSVPE